MQAPQLIGLAEGFAPIASFSALPAGLVHWFEGATRDIPLICMQELLGNFCAVRFVAKPAEHYADINLGMDILLAGHYLAGDKLPSRFFC